ncbi:MAG: peptidase [Gemmatimonadetes bacterium]|nr:peptidase [Gemmatimonadota bacterium]
MRRVPKVRQHDVTDCGVACLASIARYHGQRVSLAWLRQVAQSDRAGTSVLGLAHAAERLGYAAKGVRASGTALPRTPVPALAHMVLSNGMQHYVVLERADDRRVWIMDPALGERSTETRQRFDTQWSGVLLLLTPHVRVSDAIPGAGRTDRIWHLVRPHRGALAQALVGALVHTTLGLAISIYVQQIVDSVLAEGRVGPLHVLTMAMIGIAIAQAIVGTLRSILMVHVGQHIDASLILGYYSHLIRLPQRFFDQMRVGELTSRVNDAVKIRAFVGEVAVEGAANLLIVASSTVLMFGYDWRLATLTAATLPVYAGLYTVGSRVNRRQQRALMERAAALESHVVESLTAIGTLKRFGLERRAELMTEARFVRVLRTLGETARTGILLGSASQLVSRLAVIALLWLGATRALAQQLSAGELMSCYALLGFLTTPVLALVGFSRVAQEACVAGDRLFELMELDPEPVDAQVPLSRNNARDVRLERIHFAYGRRSPALVDVSISFPRGKVTAIVGESGSGKSTIAALLQRLYPVDQGRICIGPCDVAHVELQSLRRLVGVVPQSIDLFAGSILENLTIGEANPDVERISVLCEEVGLRETIERMPEGWLTPVGERGMALSGGERQRLAIVRALYRDPAVLVLDEATSALDPVNERLVLDAVHRVGREGATIILIAHRLTTVQEADRVVVLERGRVVEEGDPGELLLRGGAYARLWSRQTPDVWRFGEHRNGVARS